MTVSGMLQQRSVIDARDANEWQKGDWSYKQFSDVNGHRHCAVVLDSPYIKVHDTGGSAEA